MVGVTEFKKDLNAIIGDKDNWIDLFMQDKFVGTIRFDKAKNKKQVMDSITTEKVSNDYDYEKDDGSTISYISLWIENEFGYCYYMFDDYEINGSL